jgi:hypothetical protein
VRDERGDIYVSDSCGFYKCYYRQRASNTTTTTLGQMRKRLAQPDRELLLNVSELALHSDRDSRTDTASDVSVRTRSHALKRTKITVLLSRRGHVCRRARRQAGCVRRRLQRRRALRAAHA